MYSCNIPPCPEKKPLNRMKIISPYLSRKEMAEYLRCNVRTIDNRVKSGQLKVEKIGGQVLFPIEENRIKKEWLILECKII